MKRGTPITYTYAAGKVVSGVVLRPAGPAGWFVCRLVDEAGSHAASCHEGQLRPVTEEAR
jgi:ribosomal protein L35AE/L33A